MLIGLFGSSVPRVSLNDPSGQKAPFWPKKIRPPNRYGSMGFQQVKLFDFSCIVQRNPSRSGLQPSPASRGPLAGLNLHNGKHALDGKLTGLGIVRPWTFAVVQIRDTILDSNRLLR